MTADEEDKASLSSTPTPRIAKLLLVAVMLLILIAFVSDALVYLHTTQKDGNHLDESRATVALRDSASWEEFSNSLGFGKVLLAWMHTLYNWFGLETYGRRLFSVGLVFLGLLYLFRVLHRHGVFDWKGLLGCAWLLAFSAQVPIYAALGLTTYPLLLLFSMVAIHLVLSGYGRPSPWSVRLIASAIFALFVLQAPRAIVGVYAVAGTLFLGDLLRCKMSTRHALSSGLNLLLLIVPATATMVAIFVFFPIHEFFNPYRSLSLYYGHSGAERSVIGALNFGLERFVSLARSTLAPHPLLFRHAARTQLAGDLCALAFYIGLFVSLFMRHSRRFPLALFFLLGTGAHLLLSLLDLAPFGELRYFLPFYMCFPLFATLGLYDIFVLGSHVIMNPLAVARRARNASTAYLQAWQGRAWQPDSDWRGYAIEPALWQQRASAIGVVCLFTVLLCFQSAFVHRLYSANSQRTAAMRAGFSRFYELERTSNAALVLDRWTACTGRDEYPSLLDRGHYELQTYLKSTWKNQRPEDLDDLTQWAQFLTDHDSVFIITSIPFSEKFHGPLFKEARRHFSVTQYPSPRRWSFSQLERLDPLMAVWRLWPEDREYQIEAAASPPTNPAITVAAVKVSMGPKQTLVQYDTLAVSPGDKAEASVWIWSVEPIKEIALRIEVGFSDWNNRSRTLVRQLGPEPRRISLTKTTQTSDQSALIAIVNTSDKPITFFMSATPLLRTHEE